MNREATSEALPLFAQGDRARSRFRLAPRRGGVLLRRAQAQRLADRPRAGGRRGRAARLAGGGTRQGRRGRARIRRARARLCRRRPRWRDRADRPGARSQSEPGDRVVRQRHGAGVSRRRAGRGDRAPGARHAAEPVRSFHVHDAGRDGVRAFLRRPLRRSVGMGREGLPGAAEHPRDLAHRRGQQRAGGPAGGGRKAVARPLELDPDLRVSNLKDRIGTFRRPEDFAKYAEGLRKAGLPE